MGACKQKSKQKLQKLGEIFLIDFKSICDSDFRTYLITIQCLKEDYLH